MNTTEQGRAVGCYLGQHAVKSCILRPLGDITSAQSTQLHGRQVLHGLTGARY